MPSLTPFFCCVPLTVLLSADKDLNFALTFGTNRHSQSFGCTRRVWRVLTMAAPSLLEIFSPYTDPYGTIGFGADGSQPYPFSVQPDALLTVEDIMRMNRDQYDGTVFDMSKGLGKPSCHVQWLCVCYSVRVWLLLGGMHAWRGDSLGDGLGRGASLQLPSASGCAAVFATCGCRVGGMAFLCTTCSTCDHSASAFKTCSQRFAHRIVSVV